MAEGDTIHRTARRLEKALAGREIVGVSVPNPQSPLRRQTARLDELRGRRLTSAEARGKHLFLRFEGDLVIHSHLGMRGSWRVRPPGRRAAEDRGAWAVLSVPEASAIQLGGSHLLLRTEAELRADPRLRRLGPDVLAADFDAPTGVDALRRVDQTRQVGEALLDQRIVSGIGNIYKCEACWSSRVDPWRALADIDDEGLRRLVIEVAALMRYGVETGRPPRSVYRRAGRPCPRCGTRIASYGQGDANRTTYWCPSCQGGDNPRVREER